MPENCAAIVIAAKHHELTKVKDTRGTTHTIGALRCKFDFRTNDWLNSAKTAMFCNGDAILHPEVIDNAIAVPLDSDDECPVPYEVLTDTLPYSIGVWGVTNSGLRIVSKWLVFDAQQGCYTEGNAPEDPEPTIYEQILGIAQGAVNTANKVLSSAENGEFDGVSVTHSWDGSVLTLNSASGTTSTDLVGPQGNGIAYITKTSTDGLVDTYIITYTDGTTTSFTVTNGKDGEPGYTPQKDVDYFDGKDGGYYVPHLQEDGTLIFAPSDSDMRPIGSVGNIKGADGKGIASIIRTSGNGEAGTIDTYTITYTDNTESTFSIYNGKDGEEGKSAYEYAQDGGYEGSEEDFAKKLAKEEITPDWVATKTAVAGEAVFIPQQTLTSGMWSNLQSSLRAGYVYDVVFNGKVYTCISNIEDGGVYLGNVTLMDSSSTNTHNNEPFCIYWAGAGATAGFFYKDSTVNYPVDLKVTNHGGYEYDKMPKEYLPDEVALKTDIPEKVQADFSQNDPEAPDYVQNRTHYEEVVVHGPINITWDGNTEGLVQAGSAYKVSDLVLTPEYIKTCTIMRNNGTAILATDVSWDYGVDAIAVGLMYVVSKANASYNSIVFPEPGIYFLPITTSLTSDGLTEVVVHQLDEKYIPDTVARKSEIPEQVQSDWNQSIETAPDYIKNKTHGEIIVVHDSVTEEVTGTSSHPTGYGTLPKALCTRANVKMPDGKYILITIGGETKKMTTVPTSSPYREEIIFDNGMKMRICLTNKDPLSGMGDRKNFYYQVLPLADSETIDQYIGTQFTVELVSDELKQLDEKYIPDTIARVADIENTYALKTDLENVSVDLSAYETIEAAQAKLDEAKVYTDEAMASISIENIPTITPDIMMALMDEVQLACPIADVDNSILMIDDNTILIL